MRFYNDSQEITNNSKYTRIVLVPVYQFNSKLPQAFPPAAVQVVDKVSMMKKQSLKKYCQYLYRILNFYAPYP